MILSMIIVLVFAVALLVLRARNRLALVFFGGFISVDILILSLFLYIMKINSYNYFFQFEYYLIRFIGKIKLSYYDTKYLMLIAIVMFMVVMMYFYIDGSVKHTFVKTKIRDIILFTVGTMIFVVVNSNIYHESVFLWRHTVSPDKLKLIDVIADFSSLYSIVYIGIMCILPYRMFMYEYRTTELFFRKKYLSSIMLAILFLQSIFLFVLFFSPLKYFFMESGIYDIGNLSNRYKSDFDYYIVIVVLVLLTLIGAIFINSQILKEVNLFKVKYSGKKTKFSFKEVRHVFHSFKNLMALLTILNNDAIENYGTKESKENLIEMQDNIEQFSIMMNRILDVSNYNKMNYDCVNIVSCVKNAVSKFSHIEKKKVNLQIQCNEVMVYGENYGFAEAFNNLLCNAGAAIPPDGEITVKVWTENKWVCISFRDNGCGIPKKMLKKIFKPFVSSKKTFTNWGLGLAHVQEVITANRGFVNVKSKLGEYTEFQIIFPRIKDNIGDILPLMDNGHYHPTEVVSDKIPALLCFFKEIALHITRPIRWDSDHVVLFDDETREMAKEIVRCDALERVYMALDYFDASINRISAWTMGFRNWQKALLNALCTPNELLKKLQDDSKLTELQVVQDEMKTMPFGDIWNEYCRQCSVKADREWFDEVKKYEAEVLGKR